MSLPLPPAELRYMGEDDEQFIAIGDGLVRDLVELGGLRDESSVLDVGCGYGRVAHALRRAGFDGRYLGFDIVPRAIEWCREVLAPASGGALAFEHLDVRNDRYNPGGRLTAGEVSFPLADGGTDMVVATSVFTHMLPGDVQHYLAEAARLLSPRGRAFVTFFALDPTWEDAELAQRSKLPMAHSLDARVRYHNPDDPLHAIGYDVRWIHGAVAAAGLRIHATRLGTWCGRTAGLGFQDVFVLERQDAPPPPPI